MKPSNTNETFNPMQQITKTTLAALAVLIALCSNANNTHFDYVKQIETYATVLEELSNSYVDSLNYDELTEESINAMLSTLDPYTVYVPEKESSSMKQMTTGEYGGIGAIVMQYNNNVAISEPYEGFPAHKADLRCGDVIVAIDGESMLGKTTSYVSNKLRGAASTQFVIEIERPGEKRHIKKTITREVIELHPVSYYTTLADSIGYIVLNSFNEKSYNEFRAALLELTNKHGIKALIIDLRDNGGGLLEEATKIASLFLPKGTEVVSTRGRNNTLHYTYHTSLEPIAEHMPLAVLVNNSSASASEILAGALQDLDRAVIIGKRTYGKGLVQNIRPISYNALLKVTTGKYYIPSGRCVQAIDYAHRSPDGTIERIPDSLTHEFRTVKGRIVRDGCGIEPDSIVNDSERPNNLTLQLYAQNIIFDYATRYQQQHKQIAAPELFTLSDKEYEEFCQYVVERKPNYNLHSEKQLAVLQEFIEFEGYGSEVEDELKSLTAKLQPSLTKDLQHAKEEIVDLINYELVKRFYMQKGTIRLSLRNDKCVAKAVETLQ